MQNIVLLKVGKGLAEESMRALGILQFRAKCRQGVEKTQDSIIYGWTNIQHFQLLRPAPCSSSLSEKDRTDDGLREGGAGDEQGRRCSDSDLPPPSMRRLHSRNLDREPLAGAQNCRMIDRQPMGRCSCLLRKWWRPFECAMQLALNAAYSDTLPCDSRFRF